VKGRNTGMRRGVQGAGRGGKRTREEGREWRGPTVCIFKFSVELHMRLSDSHNISKRVKMTLQRSIVV